MKKVKAEKYKNFTIEIYEQQASIEYPLNEDWENLDPEHLGTHAYKIFDEKKELVYEDKTSMWDIGACLENAQEDINCGAVQQTSEQKGYMKKYTKKDFLEYASAFDYQNDKET
jgi:hypothetical protein